MSIPSKPSKEIGTYHIYLTFNQKCIKKIRLSREFRQMSWKSATFLLPLINRISGWELDGPTGSEKVVNSHGK